MSQLINLDEQTATTLAIVTVVVAVMTLFMTDLSGTDQYATVALSGVLAAIAFMVGNAAITRYRSRGTSN